MKSFSMKCSGLAFALAITGAMLAPAAEAVNLATDGIGEVAIAPYYTVRGGWLSLINITNTADEAVVVKVRFKESRNSRDVLDFNVALSAFDVFTAVLKEGGTGNTGPTLEVTDFVPGSTTVLDTCVIPHRATFDMSPGGTLAYSGTNDDGGPGGGVATPTGIDRLRDGYIEFLAMGHTTDATTVGHAIEQHWCNTASTPSGVISVEDSFNNNNIAVTARQFGEPINSLKYNYRLLNPVRGLEIAGAAITWANFYNPGARGSGGAGIGVPPSTINVQDHLSLPIDNVACTRNRGVERTGATDWDAQGSNGSCMNLITAQTPFAFLQPDLNDAYPIRANWWDDGLNAAVNVFPSAIDTYRIVGPNALPGYRGVDAVSATIQRASMINEWSNEASLGVSTDWVVNFPTKAFYVDHASSALASSAQRQFAIVRDDRDETEYCIQTTVDGVCDATETGTYYAPYPPFTERFHQQRPSSPANSNDARNSAKSCNTVRFARYDRAENTLAATGGVIPSPAPVLPTDQLCYETNVVTFTPDGALGPYTEGPLNAPDKDPDPSASDSQNLAVGGLLPSEAGWISLVMDDDAAADPTRSVTIGDETATPASLLTVSGGLEGWSGLPATGFVAKQRIFPQGVDKNFSSIIDHGYKRCFNQHLDEAGVRCVD